MKAEYCTSANRQVSGSARCAFASTQILAYRLGLQIHASRYMQLFHGAMEDSR